MRSKKQLKRRMLFIKVLLYFHGYFPVPMYHEHAVPLVPKKGAGSPEIRVTNCCEPPNRCWELNLGLLEEQPLIFCTEETP